MGLTKDQRKALEQNREFTQRIHDRIWGLLPPTRERDTVRCYLYCSIRAMDEMLKEPEQMTMDELLEEDDE